LYKNHKAGRPFEFLSSFEKSTWSKQMTTADWMPFPRRCKPLLRGSHVHCCQCRLRRNLACRRAKQRSIEDEISHCAFARSTDHLLLRNPCRAPVDSITRCDILGNTQMLHVMSWMDAWWKIRDARLLTEHRSPYGLHAATPDRRQRRCRELPDQQATYRPSLLSTHISVSSLSSLTTSHNTNPVLPVSEASDLV
jgi:hypothetical protein